MINKKRALLLLPPYLVVVIAIDMAFNHVHFSPGRPVPLWLIFFFIATAVAVTVVVIWYLVKHASGQVPQQRHHAYMSLLVAVIVSGFFSDGLKGVASLFLRGQPWWILLPIYTLGYAVFCVALVYTAGRFERRRAGDYGHRKSAV
jgi:hypothetical protein